MKRTVTGLSCIVALLLSATTGAISINLAVADPIWVLDFPTEPILKSPTVVVHSPVQNQIYNSTNVWLNFNIVKPESWFAIDVAHHADHSPLTETFVNISSVYFTVDGGERQNIPVKDIDSLFDTAPIFNLNFSTMLPLTAGAHTVKVGLEADSYYVVNYAYNFSEALSSVKLDAKSYTINLTVAGSSESDAVNFTVAGFFPTALIVTASLATVAVVGAGLRVYFKKRKR